MDLVSSIMVKLIMALTCQEDRALLESNPNAWWGFAGDSRGSIKATPSLPGIRKHYNWLLPAGRIRHC